MTQRVEYRTKILIHGDGIGDDYNFIDQCGHPITPTAATYTTDQKKFGKGSITFGAGSLTLGASSDWNFPANWGISFWWYPTNITTTQRLFAINNTQLTISVSSSTIYFYVAGSGITAVTAPTVNTWHYIVLTSVSGTVSLYCDGSQLGGTKTGGEINLSAYPFYISSYNGTVQPLIGYISEFKFISGVSIDGTIVPDCAAKGRKGWY